MIIFNEHNYRVHPGDRLWDSVPVAEMNSESNSKENYETGDYNLGRK